MAVSLPGRSWAAAAGGREFGLDSGPGSRAWLEQGSLEWSVWSPKDHSPKEIHISHYLQKTSPPEANGPVSPASPSTTPQSLSLLLPPTLLLLSVAGRQSLCASVLAKRASVWTANQAAGLDTCRSWGPGDPGPVETSLEEPFLVPWSQPHSAAL